MGFGGTDQQTKKPRPQVRSTPENAKPIKASEPLCTTHQIVTPPRMCVLMADDALVNRNMRAGDELTIAVGEPYTEGALVAARADTEGAVRVGVMHREGNATWLDPDAPGAYFGMRVRKADLLGPVIACGHEPS
jgi:hypothetical protein